MNSYELDKKQYIYNGSLWVENIFTVNIDSNIDYGESSMSGSYGTVINESSLPISVGTTVQIENEFYYLEGYYLDSAYNNKLSSITIGTSSITIYAKWEVVEEKLCYITFTDILGNQTIEYYIEGSTVTLPTQTYDSELEIYFSNNDKRKCYVVNGTTYEIIGYSNSSYEYASTITITEDINLEMNYSKVNYFEIKVCEVEYDNGWNGFGAKNVVTIVDTIYVKNGITLDLSNFLERHYGIGYSDEKNWIGSVTGYKINYADNDQLLVDSDKEIYYGV